MPKLIATVSPVSARQWIAAPPLGWAAHPGFKNPDDKGGRDGGINGIPASAQDCGTRFGSLTVLRGDDAARGFDDMLAGVLCSRQCAHAAS